jgi:hypothetical protein
LISECCIAKRLDKITSAPCGFGCITSAITIWGHPQQLTKGDSDYLLFTFAARQSQTRWPSYTIYIVLTLVIMADSITQPTQDTTQETLEEDIDASIEDDISKEPLRDTNTDTMQVDSNGASDTQQATQENPIAASAEPRIPAKKDASLREFLNKMDDYAPIVWTRLLVYDCDYWMGIGG